MVSAIFLFPVSLYSQIPTNGLIGFYPFNGNANDESGTGNHGAVQGATLTVDRCGNPNSAYRFDGVNDYITLNPDYITPYSQGTFAAWVSLNSLSTTQYLGCIADEQTIDYYVSLLRFDPGNQRFSIFQRFPGIANIIIGSTPVLANQYYFVVMTTDGNEYNLYVNGVKENLTVISGSNSGVWASGITSVDNWLLGCIRILQPYDQAFLNGTLDDIRVYNRALTQEEILRLYTTHCSIIDITGTNNVCQNQKNVPYATQLIDNATYTWEYTGSGTTIKGDSDNILIDFAENSTSGTLSVTVSGNNIVTKKVSIPIEVNKLPAAGGTISGLTEICQNSPNITFTIPSIDNALEYHWTYSGTGAIFAGSDNTIDIDFTEEATSGILRVSGYNQCGSGLPSDELVINLKSCSVDPTVLNIPNSFSPNGDGINDVFFIRNLPENSSLLIFNRNGKKLVEADNYMNDWNGKDKKGGIMESGVYWYVLNVPGMPSAFKGFVYLKR